MHAGGLQQQQVAELADQVCGLLGGCAFVDSTGDNFYGAPPLMRSHPPYGMQPWDMHQ